MTTIPVSSLWTETKNSLHQELAFKHFAEAWAYMNAVAVEAEKQDHHPNWSNVWNQVTIDLTSHDRGNTVTDRDRKLAAAADEALRQVLKPRATAFARTFTEHLVAGRFADAHAMFDPGFALTEAELRDDFTQMGDPSDPFTKWSVDDEFLMTTWPDRADTDVLWAYCGVWGTSRVEAVTICVAIRPGAPKQLGVSSIEFGRP
jgi:4a-hydroxytetrahydrobiopterin dehydratase